MLKRVAADDVEAGEDGLVERFEDFGEDVEDKDKGEIAGVAVGAWNELCQQDD